jgi:hypothetical protein
VSESDEPTIEEAYEAWMSKTPEERQALADFVDRRIAEWYAEHGEDA